MGQLRSVHGWARIMNSMAVLRFEVRDTRTENPQLLRPQDIKIWQ